NRNVFGDQLFDPGPVARLDACLEAIARPACDIFEMWGRLQLFEAGERSVEVCLVEYFAAVESFAVDRQKVDHSPLGVDAFRRGGIRHMGEDRPQVVQPMNCLRVSADDVELVEVA